jgi:predicted DNA-binding WGR domain protein
MKNGEQFQVYLERRSASRNMARYYAISLEHSLLGEVTVVRRWGRIGSRGRLKTAVAETEPQGIAAFAEALRSKRKRGYTPFSIKSFQINTL